MKIASLFVATILACSIGAGTAFAQGTTTPAPAAPATQAPPKATTTPAPPPATAAPAAKAKADPDADSDKSAISAKCSAEATKQGLHGKARKVFRSKCKRGKT